MKGKIHSALFSILLALQKTAFSWYLPPVPSPIVEYANASYALQLANVEETL